MRRRVGVSEELLIEEVMQEVKKAFKASRGLPIGSWIRMIRIQLGMSQKVLAKRAKVPQSTISRIEKKGGDVILSTLNKVLKALFCDLLILPMLHEPIDTIRRKQARKQAETRLRYLKGTMSLEEQRPDSKLLDKLLTQEEDRLLSGPDSELWGE